MTRRSPPTRVRPRTARECATLDRIGRDMTQKAIAVDLGISINTVGNLAANAYKKLGVHGAAAAVHAHRDAHFYCGTRADFGPIRERLKASRSTSSCPCTPDGAHAIRRHRSYRSGTHRRKGPTS